MWFLLTTTITTSFLDSLNPSAIAQQLLLQAMVKDKRHIWFFILGIGLANLALGLAVYYGVAAWVSQLLSRALSLWPAYIYGGALVAGLLCLLAGIRLLVKTGRQGKNPGGPEGAKAPDSLTPRALFFLGAAFCAVELTSALPYFGFLALLAGYGLGPGRVLLFILLYDGMYVLPLVLLYLGYNRLRGTILLQRLEAALSRVAAYILPVVLTLAGLLLLYFGMRAWL